MIKTRVIPCLLLKGKGLVKSLKFKDPVYIGDPINAVRIFNEKEVHELLFLDITATKENRKPDIEYIAQISDECYMPLAYGGGIRTIEDIKQILNAGAEKVCINSYAVENPSFIKEAANIFGSQSILVSIDVKKSLFGKYEVYTHGGKKSAKTDPVSLAIKMQEMGAGEILINSIDKDGTMDGYDLTLVKNVAESLTIPVIACGGAGEIKHFADAVNLGGASAVAAGSFFVFHGSRRGILINYPDNDQLNKMLE